MEDQNLKLETKWKTKNAILSKLYCSLPMSKKKAWLIRMEEDERKIEDKEFLYKTWMILKFIGERKFLSFNIDSILNKKSEISQLSFDINYKNYSRIFWNYTYISYFFFLFLHYPWLIFNEYTLIPLNIFYYFVIYLKKHYKGLSQRRLL